MEERNFHIIKEGIAQLIKRWIVPPVGWYKLNTDGSFSSDGSAGAGMIVRDHNGGIILSTCRQLSNCRDALGAELNAVLEGLSLALHRCTLIIEVDSSEVSSLLNNEEVERSVYTSVIEEIKLS